MPTSAAVADTPYYVLLDGKQRFGPEVVPQPSGTECSATYGFSDKDSYDKFCANSQLALTPYPLTKFYLRNETDAPGDSLHLVVVDAAGPREPCLQAATMGAVLEAQENRRTLVIVAHQLAFDQQAAAYRIIVNSPENGNPSMSTALPLKPDRCVDR